MSRSYVIRWAYRTYRFLSYYRENDVHTVALHRKVKLLKRGFFPNRDIIYKLAENNIEHYVSDYQENVLAVHINKPLNLLINDKLLFPELVKPFIEVPLIFALIERGKIVKYGGSTSFGRWEEVLEFVKGGNPLILKPIGGDGGVGIIKLDWNEDQQKYMFNQFKLQASELLVKLQQLKHYLISEFVEQSGYSKKIYPNSVNTIRILTMIDPDTSKAFIGAAAHRIGNDMSKPVDNCAMGGLTANIDIPTGILGSAVSVKKFRDHLKWHEIHPDTKENIAGVRLPNWEPIKSTVLEMAESLSFLPYLGWDVVITKNGFTVIEANDGTDLKLHQVHEPLLINPRVRQFYKFHNVLRK